jgi:hypothetical protein
MFRLKVLPLFALLFTLSNLNAQAQEKHVHYAVHGHFTVPVVEVFDNIEVARTGGFASLGFGVTLEQIAPVSTGLYWTNSITLLLNDPITSVCDYETSPWLNVPIMMGLHYSPALSSTLGLLLTGQLGYNIVWTSSYEGVCDTGWNIPSYDESTSEIGTTFAFSAGVGLLIDNKLIIGLRFLNLGNVQRTQSQRDIGDNTTSTSTTVHQQSMFTLSAGYIFDLNI